MCVFFFANAQINKLNTNKTHQTMPGAIFFVVLAPLTKRYTGTKRNPNHNQDSGVTPFFLKSRVSKVRNRIFKPMTMIVRTIEADAGMNLASKKFTSKGTVANAQSHLSDKAFIGVAGTIRSTIYLRAVSSTLSQPLKPSLHTIVPLAIIPLFVKSSTCCSVTGPFLSFPAI